VFSVLMFGVANQQAPQYCEQAMTNAKESGCIGVMKLLLRGARFNSIPPDKVH
jgi:hypothetical protein